MFTDIKPSKQNSLPGCHSPALVSASRALSLNRGWTGLALCAGLSLAIGLTPDAKAHCNLLDPGHCASHVQDAVEDVINDAQEVINQVETNVIF